MSIYSDIKSRVDILTIANRYLDVEQRGRNYFARCFHGEKTASLSISPQKNMFKCFGCGLSGDVIDLVMLGEGISHHEAVDSLARDLGISYRSPKPDPLTSTLQAISDLTFYNGTRTASGDLLRSHFSLETIREYHIGVYDSSVKLKWYLDSNNHQYPEGFTDLTEYPDGCITVPLRDIKGFKGLALYDVNDLSFIDWIFSKEILYYSNHTNLHKIKFHGECLLLDNPIVMLKNNIDRGLSFLGKLTPSHVNYLKDLGLTKLTLYVSDPLECIEVLHNDFSLNVVTSTGEIKPYLDYLFLYHREYLDNYLRESNLLKIYYKRKGENVL